jgi:signal transduction histidine kinase
MKRPVVPTPQLSLGVRIAIVMSLGVLVGVLLTALVLEFRGRGEARAEASEGLRRARAVAGDRLRFEGAALSRLALTISRDPKFFSLLTLRPSQRTGEYRQALERVVREFQRDAASEVFDVTDIIGTTLAASARASAPEQDRAASALVQEALSGRSVGGYRVEGGRLYRVAVVPVTELGGKVVGTLTIGSPIDDEFAATVRSASGADFVLVADAATPGEGERAPLPRSIFSTLTDAGTRSVLATIGPPTRDVKRWTARDARDVSIAKHPGLAIDVPLSGLVEGGSPRLVALVPLALGPGIAEAREALLVAGAVSALLALLVGWNMGARVGGRLQRLGYAAREARQGNYDVALPVAGRDEAGYLVADFEAMRDAQRHEVDRLVQIDQMKTDFLSVTALEISAPAVEIQSAAQSLASGRGGDAGPVTQRLQLIRRHAANLSRLAEDIGSFSVVSRLGAGGAPDEASEQGPEASVEAVAEQENFQPVHPVAETENLPVDVAALLEAIAAELILDAAKRGIEVDLAVEPELVHPGLPSGRLEADLRGYVSRALDAAPPGTTLSLAARKLPDVIEVRLHGGPEPLNLHLPLPPNGDGDA